MSLFKKISIFSKKVTEKAKSYSADELIADSIIKASKKKEKVNIILQEKGSLYRISDLELDMDFPPTVIFKVDKVTTEDAQSNPKKIEQIQSTKENITSVEAEI